jgi:hypothetical protein
LTRLDAYSTVGPRPLIGKGGDPVPSDEQEGGGPSLGSQRRPGGTRELVGEMDKVERDRRPGTHVPERLVLDLWPETGRALGLGRAATYAAARRGEIPTLRFGRRLVVPRAALEELLRGAR